MTTYTWSTDGEHLWTKLSKEVLSGPIHIVWDSDPAWVAALPLDAREWVSPVDWAVAARLRNVTGRIHVEAHKPLPPLLRFRLRLLGDSRPTFLLGSTVETGWLSLGGEHSRPGGEPPPLDSEEFDEVRRAWFSFLAAERLRHSIANFVAIQAFGVTSASAAARAFGVLVDTLTASSMSGPLSAPNSAWSDRNVVLVDDLHDQGWTDVLRNSLDGATIHAVADLRTKLPRTRRDIAGHIEDHAGLDSAYGYDAVFLDLRLTDSGAAASQLKDDLLQMADVRESFWVPPPRTLPETGADASRDAQWLTLLPRLLADAAPNIPIVLFSATARRDVIDILRPYGNVVVDFAKPRLAEGPEALTRAREGFDRALRRAEAVRNASRWMNCLDDSSRDREVELVRSVRQLPGTTTRSKRLGSDSALVDVFFDESGTLGMGTFVLGGLILEYPDREAVQRLCEELWKRDLTWGLDREWLDDNNDPYLRPSGSPPQITKYQRDVDYERSLALLDQVFENLKIRARAFGLVIPIDAATSEKNAFADIQYRRYLSLLLELLLADIVDPNVPLQIDAATRTVRVSQEAAREQAERFGRRTAREFVGGAEIFALSCEEVHPICDEIADRRRVARPVSARASQLSDKFLWEELYSLPPDSQNYWRSPKKHHPRQIHYLADWLVRLGRRHAEQGPFDLGMTPTAERWFSRGFLVPADDTFQTMVDGLRASSDAEHRLSAARCAEAVKQCAEAVQAWDAQALPFSVVPLLRDRLAQLASTSRRTPEVRRQLVRLADD